MLCMTPSVSRWLHSLNIKAPHHHTKHDLIMIRLHKRSFTLSSDTKRKVCSSFSFHQLPFGNHAGPTNKFSKFKRDCGKAGRNIMCTHHNHTLYTLPMILHSSHNDNVLCINFLYLYSSSDLEVTTFQSRKDVKT